MMDRKPPAFKMIYQFNLESRIPKDHFLRLVESAVDFSFVRDLVRRFYSDRGAPSVDPVVIFKMSLLGYFYGISSERRLAEECNYNLAFKWFLKYDIDEDTPDHSIFSKARARFGRETYEKFFAEIVRRCGEKGLIEGDRVFIDATLLKANASRKSIVRRGEYLELKQSPKEYLDAVWAENPVEGDEDNSSGPQDGCSTENGRKVRTNDAVVSKTDPDASLVARRGAGPMLAHKIHIAVADGKARIVTAVTTTPGAVHEHEEVATLLQKHRFITRKEPQEVVADTAYGVRKVFTFLSSRGIQANIPTQTTHVTARRKKEEAGFRYDADRDVWVCPEGKTMYKMSQSKAPGHTLYMVHKRACASCPRHGKLCMAKRPSIVDSRGDHLLNRVKAYTETAAAKETFKRRKCQVEPAFGELKTSRGMRQAALSRPVVKSPTRVG